MKIVTVTRYQALDGELFESEADCIEYEDSKKYHTFMRKIVSEYDVPSRMTEGAILEFLTQNKERIIEFCKTL